MENALQSKIENAPGRRPSALLSLSSMNAPSSLRALQASVTSYAIRPVLGTQQHREIRKSPAAEVTREGTSMSAGTILVTEDLTKDFAGFVAVNGVNLQVARGTIHALIGPNGAGKTTCFNLLTKFLSPSRGRIVYKGED